MTRSKAAALTALVVMLLGGLLMSFVMAVVYYPRIAGGFAIFVLVCLIVAGICSGFRDI